MHHCVSHPSAMRAKPCATWLFVGKTLEFPEAKYLCIKKMGKLKYMAKLYIFESLIGIFFQSVL